jgi:hypothetical protein
MNNVPNGVTHPCVNRLVKRYGLGQFIPVRRPWHAATQEGIRFGLGSNGVGAAHFTLRDIKYKIR